MSLVGADMGLNPIHNHFIDKRYADLCL